MSQTLTKPILLDETGQAIKTALQNIDETESQDWLLSYEDVHSEMDDNIASIAGSLEDIKDILESDAYPIGITLSISPNAISVGYTLDRNIYTPTVYARMESSDGTITNKDVTSACTFIGFGEVIGVEQNTVTAKYIYGKTGVEYTATFNMNVSVPSWEDGGLQDIQNALDAHYAGLVDLHEYWSVGDTRNEFVESTLFDESLSGTSFTISSLVLLNAGGKELATPINEHNECAFIIGVNQILWGYNSSNTETKLLKEWDNWNPSQPYTDTYPNNWKDSPIRSWLNTTLTQNVFYHSMSSGGDKYYETALFKPYKNISADAVDSSNTIETVDTWALASEKEIFGENTYADETAESSLSQFEHYKNSTNRLIRGGSNNTLQHAMWTRSIGIKPNQYDPTEKQSVISSLMWNGNVSYNQPTQGTELAIVPIAVI